MALIDLSASCCCTGELGYTTEGLIERRRVVEAMQRWVQGGDMKFWLDLHRSFRQTVSLYFD